MPAYRWQMNQPLPIHQACAGRCRCALAIDGSIVAALESGLAVYKGKPLVNSVTGEEET